MDEILCKFVLSVIGLLIIWTFVIKVPLKNIKKFHIHFGFLKGFDLDSEFYKDNENK